MIESKSVQYSITSAEMMEAGEKAKDEEIARKLVFLGYYNHPTCGRLKARAISRRAFVAWMFVAAIAVITTFCLGNLRTASWQAQAIRAQLQVASLQQALADQQAVTHNNTADLEGCMTTLEHYRTTLAQVQASVQQAAPGNPQAANMLRLIQLLSKIL